MSLAAGTTLGVYEIVAPIGAGGMGEVYRARDTTLDRDVAIKILSPAFAGDAGRLARFEREARTLAALNHPNIAAIYGVEESRGVRALVMEWVDGSDLSAMIARGPVAAPDALAIATQIAHALEAAHELGIVHRDLKPANIRVRDDGTVKVLDFGLAKAMGPGSEDPGLHSDNANSPTLTTPARLRQGFGEAGTQMGVILGTAAYMSPEQAKGRAVDKRADIWAFGVVLYEMLSGQPLFAGDSVAETIGFVATRDPDWSALPASTPANVRRLLARCLTRDPKLRLRDIGEARIALAAADGDGSGVNTTTSTIPRRHRAAWIGAALALVALTGAIAWSLKPTPAAEPRVVTRFNQLLPLGQRFQNTGRHAIAISPDGTKIAYIANGQIYLKGLDQFDAQPIRGTNEGPWEVMFSPDGQSIAYFTRTASAATLKKIGIAGGASSTLAQVESVPYGATWRGSSITFALAFSSVTGVYTVADSGGTPRVIVTVDADKEVVSQAHLLDDGARVLMSVGTRGSKDGPNIVVQSIATGARTVLVTDGSDPQLLPTGHLVYVKNSSLFAVSIDTPRLEITGTALLIVDGVLSNSQGGVAQFAIADNGTLVFAPGGAPEGPAKRTMVWVDRLGKEEPISARPRAYHHLRLSPDGKQVAVEIRDEEHDIWIWDVARESLTRLTSGPAQDGYPVWTPDGRHVFYRSYDASGTSIFRRAADGTGSAEKLIHGTEDAGPQSTSKDGKQLVYRGSTDKTARDLMVLQIDPPGAAKPLIQTEFTEDNGQISPDGRWIAYESQDSGGREIFVRPFPAVDTAKVPVSSGGGSFVKWSRDGRELFYHGVVDGHRTLVSVAVPILAAGATFTSGRARALFPMSNYLVGATQTYDVALDGRRFLMIKEPPETPPPPSSITVVTHWFEELRARVKAK